LGLRNSHGIATLGLLVALHAGTVFAGKHFDRHGNEGYDTAAECDAAVRAGTAKFYQSFTHEPPLLRAGEASVKAVPLAELPIPQQVVKDKGYGADNYRQGACDMGVPRRAGRDGVSKPLQGKFVPISPTFMVNVYYNKAGNPVRAMMRQCDNWFSHNFPRPIPADQTQPQGVQCPPQSNAPPAPEPPITVPPLQRQ
jgi:hypothetical protein